MKTLRDFVPIRLPAGAAKDCLRDAIVKYKEGGEPGIFLNRLGDHYSVEFRSQNGAVSPAFFGELSIGSARPDVSSFLKIEGNYRGEDAIAFTAIRLLKALAEQIESTGYRHVAR
jgi:hypothetical protein